MVKKAHLSKVIKTNTGFSVQSDLSNGILNLSIFNLLKRFDFTNCRNDILPIEALLVTSNASQKRGFHAFKLTRDISAYSTPFPLIGYTLINPPSR